MVCHALNSGISINSGFGLIIVDIRVEPLSFSHWQCSHVSRTANTAAHLLAKEALRSDSDRSWEDVTLDCIDVVVNTELNALL